RPQWTSCAPGSTRCCPSRLRPFKNAKRRNAPSSAVYCRGARHDQKKEDQMPMAVLKQLIKENPGIEAKRLRESFWQRVKDDETLLRAIADDVIRRVIERSFRTSSELPPKDELH